jgi:hypothetical protein
MRIVSHDEDILLLHDEDTKPFLGLSAMIKVSQPICGKYAMMSIFPHESASMREYFAEWQRLV